MIRCGTIVPKRPKGNDLIHIEAARIITGATKLCSVSKLLTDLGWETLQNRRKKHTLIILFKILHGLTPVHLNDLLPPLVQDTTSYNLWNSNHFQNYRDNTNLFLTSFFPATIRAWNDLPAEVKDALSVAAFKSHLNKDLKRPPSYYNTGTRLGQILQARLRLGCSSLNADLIVKISFQVPRVRAEDLKVHITFSLHVLGSLIFEEDISRILF